jgi:hypothetical protein
MVQEQPTNGGWVRATNGLVLSEFQGLSPTALIHCRFTDWSVPSLDVPAFSAPTNKGPFNFQDCEFHTGKLVSYGPTLTLTNCLLERVSTYLQPTDGGTTYMRNCLVYGGIFTFAPSNSLVYDNLFDQPVLTNWNGYTGGHNAYITNNSRLQPTQTNDIILAAEPSYQAGPLGNYYLLSTNSLCNAGSTSAANVTLYHYTVTTNLVNNLQIKETNSVVDVNYHYVATDNNGNPIDTNDDGTPDYLSDVNGNGQVDSGEIGWNIVGDLGLSVLITRPPNGATVP